MTDAQAKLTAARAALDDAASRGFPDKNQPSLTAIWRAAEAELNAMSGEPPGAGADLTLSPEAEAQLNAGPDTTLPDMPSVEGTP